MVNPQAMNYHESLKNRQNSFENQDLENHAKQACRVKPKSGQRWENGFQIIVRTIATTASCAFE
jgi:hypothetical protein